MTVIYISFKSLLTKKLTWHIRTTSIYEVIIRPQMLRLTCTELQSSCRACTSYIGLLTPEKVSNISINFGLDLKTRFDWKKKNYITISEISSTLVQCLSKCRALFSSKWWISSHLRWFLVYDVYSSLNKGILLLFHVCKIFNSRVSFKMLLSMCSAIVEKYLKNLQL